MSTDSTDLESGQIRCSKNTVRATSSLIPTVKRVVKILIKSIFIFGLIALICGGIVYTMGIIFLLQLIIIALVAYIAAGGGHKFIYIFYKTAKRDITAFVKYLRFLLTVRKYTSRDYTVADIFRDHIKKHPQKTLFLFENEEWTCEKVEEYSNKIANIFKSMGLQKGDTVALMMENRPEFVCIWLGLSKIGVITALINYNLRSISLTHSVNIAKCSAFIFGAELSGAVKDIKDQLEGNPKMYYWSTEETKPSSVEPWMLSLNLLLTEASPAVPILNYKVGFHDKLLYIYTSGTTGLPKAAVITNARYVFLAGGIHYLAGFTSDDRFYTPLPLYHTAGGAMSIGQAIIYGACVVIRKKFSASGYFTDVAKYECTVSQYIGEMCRYLLSTPPKPEDKNHKLRLTFGNGLRPQIWKEFVTRFNIPKVVEFYGATEGNANILNTDNKEGAIGFVSRIVPSIYPISIIKVNSEGEPIRNQKGLCIPCNPGEPGVFIGKINPSNPARAFLGYVNEKESSKKIVKDVFAKGDSAFLSGDIIVSDELGYLYFKDRTGDTFRWKGENVSTSEVEAIVSNVVQYRDCVVYGVEVPGTEGRAGMAAILDENNTLDINALADGLKKHLPSYARPLFIRALGKLEMTGTYKLKKVDLQKEGFNPKGSTDKFYYLNSKGQYEQLTDDIYNNILDGKLRF